MHKHGTHLQLIPWSISGLAKGELMCCALVAATQVSLSLQCDFSQVNDLLKGKVKTSLKNITEYRISAIRCSQHLEYTTNDSTFPDTREKDNRDQPQ